MNPWRDLLEMMWEFKAFLLVLVFALCFLGLIFGSAVIARYSECRARGFSAFYCTG